METKIEDSNIFLLGTEIEKNFRYKRAESEPEWQKIKKEPGTLVWRIEKFNVVPWPKEQYGSFYQGDSYIILNIQKDGTALYSTAFMWVGKESSTDERGTAAYKIVELDDFLKGEADLVYEAQGEETDEFKEIFPEIIVMEGGVASGLRKVEKELYKTRLLRVQGQGSKVQSYEVPLSYESITPDDSYIIDAGLEIYAWRGSQSSGFEKFACTQLCTKIKNSRFGFKEFKIYDEGEPGILAMMKKYIGPEPSEETKKKINLRNKRPKKKPLVEKIIMKLSDESGKLELTEVPFQRDSISSKDTFLIDIGKKIYIWNGKEASSNEKKMGLAFASKYVQQKGTPRNVPIVIVKEGSKKLDIDSIF